jgi:hypothetical protein
MTILRMIHLQLAKCNTSIKSREIFSSQINTIELINKLMSFPKYTSTNLACSNYIVKKKCNTFKSDPPPNNQI